MKRKVTVIEAIEHARQRIRVAAYIRVSSKSEDQENSFQAQQLHYQSVLSFDPNFELIEIYADEGITGTSVKKREDFLRMLYDARHNKFDRLIVKSVTRFGRNIVDTLNALRDLERAGVSVLFELEGLDTGVIKGELLQTVLLALAQDESEKKSADAKRASKMRSELGIHHPTNEPFGFLVDRESKNYRINPEEAQMKQIMLDMYLNGDGSDKIAKHLNELGFLPYNKKQWTSCQVIDYLKNEKNFGDVCLHKFVNEGFPAKTRRNKDTNDQTVITDHHEAIFDRAQEVDLFNILNYRKAKLNTYEGPKHTYVYTEKVKCGCCGSGLIRRTAYKGKPYETIGWGCTTHLKKASLCPLKTIKESELNELFITMFNKLRLNYGQIILPYVNDLNRLKLSLPEQKRVSEINLEIYELKKQSQSLTRCRVSNEIDSAFYYSKMNEITEAQNRLSKERSSIYARFETSLDSTKTKMILEVIENYPGTMETFEQAMFVALIKKVTVHQHSVEFELMNGFVFEEGRKEND